MHGDPLKPFAHLFRLKLQTLSSAILAVWLILFLTNHANAGGGPTGVVVVYNPTDPSAVTMANHYQRVRGIPERNMIPYTFPSNSTSNFPSRTSAWDFIYQFRTELANRGLEEQLQAVALLGVVPKLGGQNSIVAFGSGAGVSFPALIYMSPGHSQASFPTAVGSVYGGEKNLAYPDDAEFYGPAPAGTWALAAATDFTGRKYLPCSLLGYTGRSGLAMSEWFDVMNRAKARDGTKPDGTIYWPLNNDVRTTLRQNQIGVVGPVWNQRGIRYQVTGTSDNDRWVQNRPDVVGGIVGQRNATTPAGIRGGNVFRGGWIDNLTSIGGYIDFFVCQDTQMSLAKWLRAGADGASGSAYEPGAIDNKFPHAHIQTHFRAGASLAEAYWQSIQYPAEIFPMGDPLLQPWASFPNVTISAPANNAAVSGTISIAATAAATGGKTLENNLDLFVDGRRVNIGAHGETIAATRTAGGFSLDTTTLSDGWHDLRVIAYNNDSVRTQAEAKVAVTVNNAGQSIALTGPSTVNPAGTASFTANLAGLSGLTALTLQSNGRTLASFPTGGGTVNVTLNNIASFAPFSGDWTLYAVGTLTNGKQVSSPPLTVTPDWQLLPATASPSLGAASADVKYFADTVTAGFNWDTTAPTATGRITGDTNTGISLAVDAVANDSSTATDQMTIGGTPYTLTYANKPGFQVDFWFYAPENGTYEFAHDFSERVFFPTSRSEKREFYIDDQLVTEREFLIEPRRLAAGWHKVRARFAVNSGSTFNSSAVQQTAGWASWKARVRGVTNVDYGIIMPAMAASFGNGVAADVPTISSVSGNTTNVTVTTRQLTATASIASGTLTYYWARLSGGTHAGVHTGPSINTTHYEPLVIAFSANGTTTANAPTLTFNEPGSYVVGLRVAGPNGSAFQAIPITVAATASSTLYVGSAGTTGSNFVTAGMPFEVVACSRSQFGQRIPVTGTNPSLPTVQWTSNDPTGSFTLVSTDGEIARFRSLTTNTGTPTFTLTATGVNGRSGSGTITVGVLSNSAPTKSAAFLYSIAQDAGTGLLEFTAAVTDAETTAFGGNPSPQSSLQPLDYQWSVIATPPGQTLTLGPGGASLITAAASGPGTYTVKLDIVDANGVTLTETRTFTVGANGAASFLVNLTPTPEKTVPVGDMVSHSYVFSGDPGDRTYQWQTSSDGGSSWQNLAGTVVTSGGATTAALIYGPVSAADNGRRFRLQVIDSAGTASSAPGTLSVTNPAGGVIQIGQTLGGVFETDVNENIGNVTFTVRRMGQTTGAVSVRWDLVQEAATQGADYLGNGGGSTYTGTLSWAAGNAADKVLTIPITNDSTIETRERFYLYLYNASGATLGGGFLFYYGIVDDDGPGSASFVGATSTVKESDGLVPLTVRRAAPYVGTLTIGYATVHGSAISPLDFSATSGTLSWANGETADKTIAIPIASDSSIEGDETFTVALSANNAQWLGGTKSATVTIKDAPFQQWQRTWWPDSLPPVTRYADFQSATRGMNPWLFFRCSETSGTSFAGIDAAGATIITAPLANTSTGSSTLNIAGPRPAAWPGLESTNTAVTFTASGSTGTPAAYTAGASANAGTAANLAPRLGLVPLATTIPWAAPLDYGSLAKVSPTNVWDGTATTESDPTKLRVGMTISSPDFPFGTQITAIDSEGKVTLSTFTKFPVTTTGITATSCPGVTVSAFVKTSDTSRVMAILGGQNSTTVNLTNCTTNATTTVTCASTTGLVTGMLITGTNIATDTRIDSVTNATTFTITAAATGSSTGLTLTATDNTTLQVTLNRSFTNTTGLTADHLRLFLRGAAGKTLDYSVPLSGLPSGKATDGQWHHIAITIPPFITPASGPNNDANQRPRFFFDGQEANALLVRGTENLSGIDFFINFVNGLRIGAAGTTTPSTFFNGSLDEIAIFPRVLTPSEISTIATAQPASPLPAQFADSAAPAGDGMPNLLKYALGLNPLSFTSAKPLSFTMNAGNAELSFTRRRDATDITYRVERSLNLSSWSEVWTSQGDPYPDANVPQLTEMLYQNEAGVPRVFYRLRVTRP